MNMKQSRRIYIFSFGIIVLFLIGVLLLEKCNSANSETEKPDFRKIYHYAISTSNNAYDAFKELKQYAEQGEAIAQYYIGNIYQSDQDHQQAIFWYTEAAEQGNVDALYELGSIYKKNKASQQAAMWFTQAVEKFREAADSGDLGAQYDLGLAYDSGNGVKQDTRQALIWITKAAEKGYSPAQNMLGYWLLTGHHGITRDIDKGIDWCLKAAEQNNSIAENNLSYTYGKFSATHRDVKKYVYWLRRAAEDGNTDAQWQLGCHYEMGDCEGIEKDYQQALYWYQRGAEFNSDCTFSLAKMYRDGKGVEKNTKLYEYWYLRANAMFSDRINDRYKLAGMYETGNDFVSQDIYQAQRWYRRAANRGHSEAQYHLGKICMGDKDYQQAIFWLKKSAERDNLLAAQTLGVIYRDGVPEIEKDEKEAEIWERKAKEIIQRRNGLQADASNAFKANASITGDKVNIRSKPNTSSNVVKQLNAGHPVKATKQTKGKDGTWYFIQTASGTQGWVFGKYVKLN